MEHIGRTRMTGLSITVLAGAVAGILALPGSWSDLGAVTVYPLMLLPALVITGVAGLVAAGRPGAARVAAVVSGVTGLQVAGIAVVASRDWLNFGGAGEASFERGLLGSWLATVMIGFSVAIVAVSVRLYGPGRGRLRRGSVVAGVIVAAGVPLLLCGYFRGFEVPAVGQFALWWSLPWAAGLVAAGSLPERRARRAALGSVAVSVALTLACAAASPALGFGLRMPLVQ